MPAQSRVFALKSKIAASRGRVFLHHFEDALCGHLAKIEYLGVAF
jgi:hypothetical protein